MGNLAWFWVGFSDGLVWFSVDFGSILWWIMNGWNGLHWWWLGVSPPLLLFFFCWITVSVGMLCLFCESVFLLLGWWTVKEREYECWERKKKQIIVIHSYRNRVYLRGYGSKFVNMHIFTPTDVIILEENCVNLNTFYMIHIFTVFLLKSIALSL